jgi:DNA replication and repair protein RecF
MISNLRLQNFRSYRDETFEFSPGINIIVGPNASGKTNLLEALLVIARGSSYRAKDAELIKIGRKWLRLDAQTNSGIRTVKISTNPGSKQFELDKKVFMRLPAYKIKPVVLFEPNHLLLLTGAPELRRDYFDDLIGQIKPAFGPLRRQYKKVLSQRNSLLKSGLQAARQQIFVWNLRLSELGGRIVQHRVEAINELNTVLPKAYQDLSRSKARVFVEYHSTCKTINYETNFLKQLEANLGKDCLLGFTTIGPHRDDIKVFLNGLLLENTASRGETRTMIMALKIAELEMLEKLHETKPAILLDDVFSELDGARRQALTNYLQLYQTFITTTDADLVVQHFTESCNIIPLNVS